MGRRKAKPPHVDQRIGEAWGTLAVALDSDLPRGLQKKIVSLVEDLEELATERGRKMGFSLCMEMLINNKLPLVSSGQRTERPIVDFAEKKATTGSWWK